MEKKYKDENDYELLYLISENNDEAKNLFYEKYDNIIKMKASKYIKYVESRGYDFNDLLQEGRLGLTNAINGFKEKKETSFYSFANICIDRQLATFIRNMSREKHKALNTSVSLDTPNTVGRPLSEVLFDDKNIDPELFFERAYEKEELYNRIENELSPQERDIFNLRLNGFSTKEIIELLNVTPKSVYTAMARIKSKVNNIIIKNSID